MKTESWWWWRMRDVCVGNNLNENSQIKTALNIVHLSTESLHNWTRWLQKYKWPYWDWPYILQRLICIETLLQRLFSSVHYSIEYIDSMCPQIFFARSMQNEFYCKCLYWISFAWQVYWAHFFISFSLFKVWILNCVFAVCLFVCNALYFLHSLLFCLKRTQKYLACERCLRQSFGFFSLRRVVYFWMENLLICLNMQ